MTGTTRLRRQACQLSATVSLMEQTTVYLFLCRGGREGRSSTLPLSLHRGRRVPGLATRRGPSRSRATPAGQCPWLNNQLSQSPPKPWISRVAPDRPRTSGRRQRRRRLVQLDFSRCCRSMVPSVLVGGSEFGLEALCMSDLSSLAFPASTTWPPSSAGPPGSHPRAFHLALRSTPE